MQYLVDTQMVSHKYISVGQEDFEWQNVPAKSVVFFDGQPEGKNNLLPSPPSTFKYSATYTNRDKKIIGYAWANTQVELQPIAPFPIARGGFPVTIITIFSALAIIGLLLRFFQFRVKFERMTDQPGLRMRAEFTLRRTAKKEADEGA